jgi:putative ABC transport system permease protein
MARSASGFRLLESFVQDIRYGLRGLLKSPGFSTVAILTLALGIGASTAIFSIVNAIVLRPLPYKDSNRLAYVWTISPMFPEFHMGQSKLNLDEIQKQNRSFKTLAVYQSVKQTLTGNGNGEPVPLSIATVSSDFLNVFAVQPALGRGFLPGDDEAKNGNVVVLSHALWQSRFGGNPHILGQTLTLDDKAYSVAGVLPATFSFPEKTEAWIPLIYSENDRLRRLNWKFFAVGRLADGVAMRTAQAEMDNIAGQLSLAFPQDAEGMRFLVMPVRDSLVKQGDKTELWILVGAVSFLLLIGCANVSNLILSRGVQRRREIALRAALGASRGRILRQLLVESLLLSMVGGLGGLLLAGAGIAAFRSLAPQDFARVDEVHLEPVVALIAFLVSALAGVLSGLAPALHTVRTDVNLALKDHSASSTPRRLWLRTFLVSSEVALALVLLTGSALMVESFSRLMKVDAGFRTDHLLTARVALRASRYPTPEAKHLFLTHLLETLRAEPQFHGVALSSNSILRGNTALMGVEPGYLGVTEKGFTLEVQSASPGYFETLGIPLLAGRSFNDRDTEGAPPVIMINQAMAHRLFPGEDPVGKIVKLVEQKDHYQIIGVAGDVRDVRLRESSRLEVYFPLLQVPFSSLRVMVRSAADPLALTKQLQECVWSLDKGQPLTELNTMDATIAESVAEPRFHTWLLTAFAVAGLALTLIGIYGVISYSVSQRTQEMGIRIALGARAEDVRRLILKQGVRLALLGAVIGLLASLGLTRLLTSQLYEVKPGDPLTLIGAALLMLAVAVCASYIPARRATKVDPMIALRHE